MEHKMKYVTLDHDDAHEVVDSNRFLEWDGYDIVTWRADTGKTDGFTDRRGEMRNGKWGIRFIYPLHDDGTWRIPSNYVTHAVRR